jgi:membrane-bound metal-dependent hydrolase YbcI (DUF457 family)
LAVAPLLGLTQLSQALLFASVTAGWSLAPDLDHPNSWATHSLGWLTGGLSSGLRQLSGATYRWTRRPLDRESTGTHRYLTHAPVFLIAVGTVVWLVTLVGGQWMVLCPLAVGILLGGLVLGRWVLLAGTVPVGWGLLAGGDSVSSVLGGAQGWIGLAVAVGCITHCLGDAVTEHGCPLFAPFPVQGQAWRRIRPPSWLRFEVGGKFETRRVFPVFVVLGVLLVPGVLPVVVGSVAAFV